MIYTIQVTLLRLKSERINMWTLAIACTICIPWCNKHMHTKITPCALLREGKKERVPSVTFGPRPSLSPSMQLTLSLLWERIMTLMDNKDPHIDKMAYEEYLRTSSSCRRDKKFCQKLWGCLKLRWTSLFKKPEPAHEIKAKPGKVGTDGRRA